MVVDDHPYVARGMARFLARDFDAVHVAHDPVEAEVVLANEDVTQLICDYFLGEGIPLGTDLVPKWRKSHPGIRVAVLVSGSEFVLRDQTASIDAFFPKPIDTAGLRAALADTA